MDKKLKEIIEKSSFEVLEGRFVYAKVNSVLDLKNHFMVSQDKDEITVVTREENLAKIDLIERNKESYKLIALNVSSPFYSVGFLANVSSAITKKGLNILIISTYSKDYLGIKEKSLERAKRTLLSLGFRSL